MHTICKLSLSDRVSVRNITCVGSTIICQGDGSVTVRALGLDLCGLSIAGPTARKVLAKVTDEDVSHDAFKFMAFKEIDLGMIPVMIGRITFTGDLGYEIWVKPEFQRTLFDNLLEAGEEFGIRPFGSRALNAMRLEKTGAPGPANTARSTACMRQAWAGSSICPRTISSAGTQR